VVAGSAVRQYCSDECMRLADVPVVADDVVPPPQRRHIGFRIGLGLTAIFLLSGGPEPAPPPPVAITPAIAAQLPPPEPPMFGPGWPPSEADWSTVIASDAWLHPLDGPQRHMPIRDSRVFGAERPGDRPAECRSGHCGVDIGQTWGEHVYAVHDGVVDRVQRGPNEDHGGIYVRISHRGGTVFTQYFHLCAVPRQIQTGVQVKAGQLIGLLGDTGVKESGPHLHFTISVRPSSSVAEQFMDPEPLIALWPLRVPLGAGLAAAVSASADPGVPRGANRSYKKKKKKDIEQPPRAQLDLAATPAPAAPDNQ
jgi:murein DD-endopeptidase MepM/ murein hydrolase activator NlpD